MCLLPVVLRAAQLYSDAEATRQASFGLLPEVIPDFSAFEDLTFRDGAAHLLIEADHGRRIFDPAVGFFLKIGEAYGGNVLFNSRLAGKPEGKGKWYVRFDIGNTHVYINRVIKDAQPGLVVREAGTNFRSHLPEDLVVRDAPLRDGPNKHITGRWDAIEGILQAYDRGSAEAQAHITRSALEDLLSGLLVLADGRAIERGLKVVTPTPN